ncbi:MAG: ORF6N domain-containing protein [Kiritimatiellae bacterium]|nr:ORF6N domain-containing protein [Kiritimatiellia bacterium]
MDKNNSIISLKTDSIRARIFNIHQQQVMLDRDLAVLYETETRTLKQTVKRNIDRFPPDFMFELSGEDIKVLVSQSVIPSKKHLGGAVPYAFTEQGVSMLSSILRTPQAVDISIKIMRAFVEMRRFLQNNADVFARMESVELRQLSFEIKTEDNFEKVFSALQSAEPPKQGIFFNGQIFDAYTFASDLVRKAKVSIRLIDNYVDDTVLTLLAKRKKGVGVTIYTQRISKQLRLDLEKHNAQYPGVEIKKLTQAHDRFLIIDDKQLYHFGASLKDLGKKWFAFSRMDRMTEDVLQKLSKSQKKVGR